MNYYNKKITQPTVVDFRPNGRQTSAYNEFEDYLPEPPSPIYVEKPKKKGWLVAALIFCVTLFIILLTRLVWVLQTRGGKI